MMKKIMVRPYPPAANRNCSWLRSPLQQRPCSLVAPTPRPHAVPHRSPPFTHLPTPHPLRTQDGELPPDYKPPKKAMTEEEMRQCV